MKHYLIVLLMAPIRIENKNNSLRTSMIKRILIAFKSKILDLIRKRNEDLKLSITLMLLKI
jgi:hypothetical protein